MRPRTVFVISDLHLGGDPEDPAIPGGRGFRMCHQGGRLAGFIRALAARKSPCELVIAGDFVDFLAERTESETWTPFHREPGDAERVFRLVAQEREPAVFHAMRDLLAAGHRLTILLGNHDLELSLPAVRSAIEEVLEAGPGRAVDLAFVYDNEAYAIGDAVIEHGNRADPSNEVDHDALRAVRVLQSRRADSPRDAPFTPPVGSRVVAELMNPLKERWPFIDLLKPEGRGMAPVLLAMEPRAAFRLPKLIAAGARAAARAAVNRIAPRFGQEIAGGADDQDEAPDLRSLVQASLPPADAAALMAMAAGATAGFGQDISSGYLEIPAWRADAAFIALRGLIREDRTFDMAREQGSEYRRAAEGHAENGFSWIVFGHTHRAVRETDVGLGAVYLNTGTWADLMRVPKALCGADPDAARAAASEWLDDVHAGQLERWVLRRPTYVRLDLGAGGKVSRGVLCELRSPDPDDPANDLEG